MPLSKEICLLCGVKKRPLFCFPANEDRLKRWLHLIDKELLLVEYAGNYIHSHGRLCSMHFGESSFTSTLRTRISKFAEPLCISVDEDSEWIDIEESAPSSVSSVSTPVSSRYRPRVLFRSPKTRKILHLTEMNRRLKKQLNTFAYQVAGLDSLKALLSASQYEFILSQIKVARLKDKRGSRWSFKEKAMALNIYLRSPSAYRILRKSFFFPSKSTLRRSTEHIAKYDGFCPKVQSALATKAAKMTEKDKFCMLVFDEMSIKSYLTYNAALDVVDGFESCDRENGVPPQLATQALVFMIRGITQNWKQVIAYYFRANSAPERWLKDTVLETLEKVHSCGFRVIGTVCDQGPMNQALYKSLGVNSDKPYFILNDMRIYTLFDMPHLLKSARNNFKKYNVKFNELKVSSDGSKSMVASWSDIEKFYQMDSKQKFRVAPKLTYSHVFARGLASMKVKLAAQIFSHSVAAGLCVYADTGRLTSRALQTAEFIGSMNDLFDSLNSKQRFAKGYASAVSEGSEHVDFWEKSSVWIKNWEFVASNRKIIKPASQRGLILTIQGALGIWKEVSKELSYLMTNRLNQDCIENTFSTIRRHGGFRDNPSSFDFRSAVRSAIVHSFLKRDNSNCEDDGALNLLDISSKRKIDQSMLVALSDDRNHNDDSELSEDCDETLPLVIDEMPIPSTTVIEDNVIAYIVGFLANKYTKNEPCEECEKILIGQKILDTHTLLLYFKEYKDSAYGLKWPTDELYHRMRVMSEVFHQNKNFYLNKPRVRKNLFDIVQKVDFDFFNEHSHKDAAKNFFTFSFVTMMIKHELRKRNGEIYRKLIMDKPPKKKLKHVKNM